MTETLEFITTQLLSDDELVIKLSKGRMKVGEITEIFKEEAVSIYEQGYQDGKDDAIADGEAVDPAAEPMKDISERINKTFNVLDRLCVGIIAGNIPAAIVSGAAGCGKTYSLEKTFRLAGRRGEIPSYNLKRGVVSPVHLYMLLYEMKDGGVLQLDDMDGIFADTDMFNLLKSALDSGKTRTVCWTKESKVLESYGVPNEFEFEGSVVFVTNVDFVRECERETKFSPHFKALMSRALYVDLGIHTKREVMARIIQVVYGKEFLAEHNLTKKLAEDMIEWLHANMAKVRDMSIRSIVHLTNLLKTDPDWKYLASELMLKKK